MKGLRKITRRERVRALAALQGPGFAPVLEVYDRCTSDEAVDLLAAMLDSFDPYAEDRILRIAEVENVVGLSRSTIHRKVADGTFPAPFDLIGFGDRPAVGWENGKVREWLRARARE